MTPTQFRCVIASLKLTQAEVATFLGISIRTAHGYANGHQIPEGYAKLLRLMIKLNLAPEDIK